MAGRPAPDAWRDALAPDPSSSPGNGGGPSAPPGLGAKSLSGGSGGRGGSMWDASSPPGFQFRKLPRTASAGSNHSVDSVGSDLGGPVTSVHISATGIANALSISEHGSGSGSASPPPPPSPHRHGGASASSDGTGPGSGGGGGASTEGIAGAHSRSLDGPRMGTALDLAGPHSKSMDGSTMAAAAFAAAVKAAGGSDPSNGSAPPPGSRSAVVARRRKPEHPPLPRSPSPSLTRLASAPSATMHGYVHAHKENSYHDNLFRARSFGERRDSANSLASHFSTQSGMSMRPDDAAGLRRPNSFGGVAPHSQLSPTTEMLERTGSQHTVLSESDDGRGSVHRMGGPTSVGSGGSGGASGASSDTEDAHVRSFSTEELAAALNTAMAPPAPSIAYDTTRGVAMPEGLSSPPSMNGGGAPPVSTPSSLPAGRGAGAYSGGAASSPGVLATTAAGTIGGIAIAPYGMVPTSGAMTSTAGGAMSAAERDYQLRAHAQLQAQLHAQAAAVQAQAQAQAAVAAAAAAAAAAGWTQGPDGSYVPSAMGMGGMAGYGMPGMMGAMGVPAMGMPAGVPGSMAGMGAMSGVRGMPPLTGMDPSTAALYLQAYGAGAASMYGRPVYDPYSAVMAAAGSAPRPPMGVPGAGYGAMTPGGGSVNPASPGQRLAPSAAGSVAGLAAGGSPMGDAAAAGFGSPHRRGGGGGGGRGPRGSVGMGTPGSMGSAGMGSPAGSPATDRHGRGAGRGAARDRSGSAAGAGAGSGSGVAAGAPVASPGRGGGRRGGGAANVSGTTAALLSELRGARGKGVPLARVRGHIVECAQDQHGSRFLQAKLGSASAAEVEAVFVEVFPDADKLTTDVFGNYVVQRLYEHGTGAMRVALGNRLRGNVLEMSVHMYACRVVQEALTRLPADMRLELARELDGSVLKCVHDQNANHVLQRAILELPPDEIEFIVAPLVGHGMELARHPYGCRIFQRLCERATGLQKAPIVGEVVAGASELITDQYGNYCLQHLLKYGNPKERAAVVALVKGRAVELAHHKFASNVIERCLQHGTAADRREIIGEILAGGTKALEDMIRDQFANYALQTVIDVVAGDQREAVLAGTREAAATVAAAPGNKHTTMRVDKVLAKLAAQ